MLKYVGKANKERHMQNLNKNKDDSEDIQLDGSRAEDPFKFEGII